MPNWDSIDIWTESPNPHISLPFFSSPVPVMMIKSKPEEQQRQKTWGVAKAKAEETEAEKVGWKEIEEAEEKLDAYY